MRTSDSIKEIAAALVKAQVEIKAAVKDSTNPFFKNKYADLASIIEAVRIPLTKNGICFLQPASTVADGVAVETVLLHWSGEWVAETLIMPVNKHDAQALGSATTYGRRYGLQSMCGVPSEDDDGERAVKTPINPASAKPVTKDAWDSLPEVDKSRLVDLSQVAKEYIADGDIEAAVKAIDDAALDVEHKVALWSRFDSKQRAAMKKAAQDIAMREGTVL